MVLGGVRVIEAENDETDIVDVFIYYDQTCKEDRAPADGATLQRTTSFGGTSGVSRCFQTDIFRWRHRADFEGSSPAALSIERTVRPGWDVAERFAGVIAAVALTKQSAAESIEGVRRRARSLTTRRIVGSREGAQRSFDGVVILYSSNKLDSLATLQVVLNVGQVTTSGTEYRAGQIISNPKVEKIRPWFSMR
jgi:hypothetical protein